FGHLLVLRDVADPGQVGGRQAPRVRAQHFGRARGRWEDVHQRLDERGLARAVRADQSVDRALGDLQSQTVECRQLAKTFDESFRANWNVHEWRPPLPAAGSSRAQWRDTASITSSSSIPSFLASTTSCSTSVCRSCERSAAVDDRGAATTVPIPGITSSRPWAIRWVTTLCAVLGLILRSLLRARTEGNGSPGRICPAMTAFLAA